MKVLVACEESQEVCKAFRAVGHEAYSCDIQKCSGGHPEWHILGDVVPLLNGNVKTVTMGGVNVDIDGQWDLIIAHPPCTYLTISGNAWFDTNKFGDKARKRYRDRYSAIVFFMQMVLASAPKIAVENPVGIMNTAYRKADQIIQPYEYGHPVRKATCLWLKGLPHLRPTNIVSTKEDEHGFSIGGALRYARDDNGRILAWNDPRTAKERSKTFQGIAQAMAEQWGTETYQKQISLFN